MNNFASSLAQDLGVEHRGPWTQGVMDMEVAVAMVSSLNNCSNEVAQGILAALQPYTQEPGCNQMFYGAIAAHPSVNNNGEATSLANASFIDITNLENNIWGLADVSGDLSVVYCNGFVVGLVGVAPAGVDLDTYSANVIPNIPNWLYGFMGFVFLVSEGGDGVVSTMLGLVDSSGVDLEWFEFDTTQTAYLVAKNLFLNGGTFNSILYRAAMYGRVPINGVTFENNDAIAEPIMQSIDMEASGVIDVTPAEEEYYEEDTVEEDTEEEDTVEEDTEEDADELFEDDEIDFDVLPNEEAGDLFGDEEADEEVEDFFDELTAEPEEDDFLASLGYDEDDEESDADSDENSDNIEGQVAIFDADDLDTDEVEDDEVDFDADASFDFDPIEDFDADASFDPIEDFEAEVLSDEEPVYQPAAVSLGRDDLVTVLRRVLGASDSLVTLLIGEHPDTIIDSETPVNIDAVCHVLAAEFYADEVIQSFILLADQYADDEATIKCGDAVEVLASAIWGDVPDYSREPVEKHAATILNRHRDALWLGVYHTDAVLERLTTLGYNNDVCYRVSLLMEQVKADIDTMRDKLIYPHN